MEPSDSEEEKEPEPDAKTLEFYRIGPPIPSILRKPGVPPRRLQLPERRVSFSQDVVDPPPRRRPLQRKHSTAEMWGARREGDEDSRSPFIKKVSLVALCSFAMVTLVGVFWGYIIHGIVHSEGQEEKSHPSLPDKGVLKIADEETLRNIEDSDYSVPNLIFMTAKSHRRRGGTPVVVIKRYSPTAPYWSRAPRSAATRRSKFRRKAKKESRGDRSKVLLVPAIHDVNDTVPFTASSTAESSWNNTDTAPQSRPTFRRPGTFSTGENVSYSTVPDVTAVASNGTPTVTVANDTTELYRAEDGVSNGTDGGNEDFESDDSSNVTSLTTDSTEPERLSGNVTDSVKVPQPVVVTGSVSSSASLRNNGTVTQRRGQGEVLNGTEEYYYD